MRYILLLSIVMLSLCTIACEKTIHEIKVPTPPVQF